MKAIIRLIFAGCLMFMLAGCAGEIDYKYTSVYVYTNNTTEVLDVKVFSYYSNSVGSHSKEFTIPVNGSYELKLSLEGDFPPPLRIGNNSHSSDFISIEYGDVEYLEEKQAGNMLFNADNYTVISEDKLNRKYEFVFTDGFFDSIE